MKESFNDLRKIGNKAQDTKQKEVEKREQVFKDLNFSNESISSIKENSVTFFTNIKEKIENLRTLGFKNPNKIIENSPSLLNFNQDLIKEKIENLRTLGFENPNKLIENLPALLGSSQESIKEKIENLKRLGFENPNKLINTSPRILSFGQESIKEKIENLKRLGFENPNKIINSMPSILGYNQDSVKEKIENLRTLGFENPNKLINSMPSILSYKQESIKEKIENLKNLGFKNPNKLINATPQILGLNKDGVKNKAIFYDKISKLYELPMTGNNILENVSAAWGSKRMKVIIILSIYKELLTKEQINSNNLNRILIANLESTIIAYGDITKEGDLNFSNMITAVDKITKQKLSKEEKQRRILELKDRLPKIVERYFEAYPTDEDIETG